MVSLRRSGSEFATLLGPSGELGLAQQPLACHALSLRRGSEFAKSPLPRTPHSPDCHCGSPLAFQSFLTKPYKPEAPARDAEAPLLALRACINDPLLLPVNVEDLGHGDGVAALVVLDVGHVVLDEHQPAAAGAFEVLEGGR